VVHPHPERNFIYLAIVIALTGTYHAGAEEIFLG